MIRNDKRNLTSKGGTFLLQEELSVLENFILEIATEIGAKKRNFDLDEIYKICNSQLSYSKEEIVQAIKDLYKKKYLIKHHRITKLNILDNENRRKIYEYIEENPGAHVRELRDKFSLGAYEAFRNLEFLEMFELVRSKKFSNKVVYFITDFEKSQEDRILLFKNIRTKLIYDQIISNKKIRLSEIGKNLNLDHGQIQPHIQKLLDFNLIDSVLENNITCYTPKVSDITKDVVIKREYDYIGGNIRFKVVIQNNSETSISNISVTLSPSEQFFWDKTVQHVPVLQPHSTRGVDFTLIPNSCGKSSIFGAVSYQDSLGKAHTITVNPKDIAIKCPLVVPQKMSPFEIEEWINKLKRTVAKINFGDLSQDEAFKITISQIEALDLSRISINQKEYSALYSGKAKVSGQQIVVEAKLDPPYIIIEVWADDLTQSTGLLAYIRNMINILLDQAFKKLEKSEETFRKLTEIFNYNNEFRECYDLCGHDEKVRNVMSSLANIKSGLEQYYPDFKVLSAISAWLSKFKGMYDEENCIDKEMATELKYDLIQWLNQLKELVTFDVKKFKDEHRDYENIKESLVIGQKNIDNNIELLDKDYGRSILNYIIVLHKENGLALYQEQLIDINLDADLISGFITAIQSFGTELSSKETPVKGLEYENYKIEIESGKYIRGVLLLSGKPNTYIKKSLADFVGEFENKYSDQLRDFLGVITPFQNSTEIFHKIFSFK